MKRVNAAFEAIGAVLAWHSAALALETPPAGVSWLMVAFSALWAVECVPYYRAHGDRWSAAGACVRCAGHLVWCWAAIAR